MFSAILASIVDLCSLRDLPRCTIRRHLSGVCRDPYWSHRTTLVNYTMWLEPYAHGRDITTTSHTRISLRTASLCPPLERPQIAHFWQSACYALDFRKNYMRLPRSAIWRPLMCGWISGCENEYAVAIAAAATASR